MKKKIGAVLVVGGGIAGIQSSLDLANSGFKVYLLENSPAIGGTMSQLDKTFPTNDCAMCILAPKLVETGRHQNIEIISQADIEKIAGEAGDFKVAIKKRPRYIIEDKCTGCGECAEVCPVERPNVYEENLANRKAIYRPYAQAIPNIFTISKNERPSCTTTCPLNTNAQGYIALIRQGKFKEALALIKEKNPLPLICGRVCTHPCETECNRRDVDEPIAIATLKRFAADYELAHGEKEIKPAERTKAEKVAIIGSGPAGLTCAHDLVKLGYGVTIFEALPKAGGMLTVGIPSYRLPKDILEIEIGAIQRLGVEIKLNTSIGRDLTIDDLFARGYKAIFISVGAHKSRKLGIPREDSEDVVHGIEFLRDLNLGKKVKVKEKVAIIGGGDVAIDAARSALRLGAKDVFVLYRRSRKEMPASDEEVDAAQAEGIKIQYLVAPVEVLVKDGKVVGVKCIRMKLGEPDASGRRRPIPIEGSEFNIQVEMIIPAIGQAPDASFLPGGKFNFGRGGTFEVDSTSLATNVPGVFAGGDAVIGPATVIEAMAAGRRASTSIDRYLKGEDLKANREGEFMTTTHAQLDIDISKVEKRSRQQILAIPMERRTSSFDEVNLGFTEDMAVREAQRCLDCGICSECHQCVEACKAEAIDFTQSEQLITLDVGSIVLAPGFDEFEPGLKKEYGYDRYPNVVSSIEFERILSASGPYQGKVMRPSDGEIPKKIAFILCVGSRDEKTNEYCSSVCCMYSIKEAVIAKEHTAGVEPHVFFMDIRAFGKEFDNYYTRAEKEYRVKFTRCRVASVEEIENNDLIVRYVEDGDPKAEKFDLVVLSVGLGALKCARELSEKLGIDLNEYNFCSTKTFSPIETSKLGVYVCGAFSGPKDIPDTVAQASGAAAKASSLISSERGKLVAIKEYPPEIEVEGAPPRIGVFVCHCGINIGGVVDVPAVTEYARTLPNVVYAEDNLYTCSQDTQKRIKEKIKEEKLNRVVVAACTPRTHEPLFQETLRESGLNPYLFEFVNIRDQCSWIHMHELEKALEKAKDLVRMGVAKARLLEPLHREKIGVTPSALVIGGGLSGMVASLGIAKQGFEVHLVEKESELGGNLRKLHYLLSGEDPKEELDELITEVEKNERIHVYKNTVVTNVEGYIGNFKTTLDKIRNKMEINHGVTIVATGGEEYKPKEYLYGEDDRVVTQLELEEALAKGNFKAKTVVMIQCVGSRNEERSYCSRVCCAQAITNALKIKEKNPDSNVYVLYKDVRTYGFKERYFKEASNRGVTFIRYDNENKPQVKNENGALSVTFLEPILKKEFVVEPDLLVLSAATLPQKENEELARMLKVPLSKDGFFLEVHMKLRPVEFATDGIFLCGLAHSPKFIDESISQACATASKASIILSQKELEAESIVVEVNEDICSGCGICEPLCEYKAIEIETTEENGKKSRKAKINEALCKGCGSCVAACPSGALEQKGFTTKQIYEMISSYFGGR